MNFDNYYELSWIFNRRHKMRCFINASSHLTPYANEVVCEYIFDEILKKNIWDNANALQKQMN